MKKYTSYQLLKVFFVFILFLWIGTGPDVFGGDNDGGGKSQEELNYAQLTESLFYVQSFNSNNPDLWKNALGRTVAEPGGASTQSQAASAQSTSQEITLTQQQEIDRIRRETKELEARMQTLVNQYNRTNGNVGKGWNDSWDSVRRDWENLIGRQVSRPSSGSCGEGIPSGGGSDSGTGESTTPPATSEPPSGPTSEGESCGSGTEPIPEPVSECGPGPVISGPGGASDLE